MTTAAPNTRLQEITVPFGAGLITAAWAFAIYYATSFAVMYGLLIAGKLVFGAYPSRVPGHPVLEIAILSGQVAAAWFAYARLRKLGWRAIRRPTKRDIAVYALAALVVLILYTIDGIVMHSLHVHDPGLAFRHFSVRDPNPATVVTGISTTLLTVAIGAPFFEEAATRALLFGALLNRFSPPLAALIAAIIFGALHFHLTGFPLLASYALVATASYALTRNLLVPIALHITTNTILTALLIHHSLSGHKI